MANKAESENRPWPINLNAPDFTTQNSQDIEQKAQELIQFLSGESIDMIKINSIIPSSSFGVLVSVTLGKLVTINNTSNKVLLIYNTDGTSLDKLQNGIDLMGKKKQKKQKDIIHNLKSIREYISEPGNWGPMFNPDGES